MHSIVFFDCEPYPDWRRAQKGMQTSRTRVKCSSYWGRAILPSVFGYYSWRQAPFEFLPSDHCVTVQCRDLCNPHCFWITASLKMCSFGEPLWSRVIKSYRCHNTFGAVGLFDIPMIQGITRSSHKDALRVQMTKQEWSIITVYHTQLTTVLIVASFLPSNTTRHPTLGTNIPTSSQHVPRTS